MRLSKAAFGLLFAAAFGDSSVRGGDPGYMHDAEHLPDYRNKIAVLEYANPGGARWGLELSEILMREIIGSIRGVPGVGVLNLRQDEQHMELTLPNVTALARRQKAQVVVWGEFYEGGDKTYFHSHLEIVPSDESAKPSVSLSVQTQKGLITATAPSLVVNFKPVEFTTASLRALKESHLQSTAIRSDPTESARAVATLRTTDGFSVEEVTGQWMKIRTNRSIPATRMIWTKTAFGLRIPRSETRLMRVSGWVHYATLESRKELSELQNVVRFAQGALQYLVGNYETAEATMIAYLNGCGEQDEANRALAHILLANARFRGGESTSDLRVAEDYLAAAELLPHEAAPVNYLATFRLLKYGDKREYVPEMRDLEIRLIRAVQQNNKEALRNLRVFYQLAAENGFAKPTEFTMEAYSDALGKQLTLVDDIAKKLDH